MKRNLIRLPATLILLFGLLLVYGCNLPFTSSSDVNLQVTQTLAALATQVAAAQSALTTVPAAPAAPSAATTAPAGPVTPPANTPAPVTHSIMPGNMQAIESTIDDLKYSGDFYNANQYERPYTEVEMVYHPEDDLQKVTLSTDNTFFYFDIGLKDVSQQTKLLDGDYGIEIDTNRDGRGEFLLWSYQPPTINWDTAGIVLYTDSNHDVGGAHPLASDAPFQGDGYETEVWPGKPTTDPDGAWIRIDPNSPTSVQLAVKRSLLGNPSSFMWSAWADSQIKAPYLFAYNDTFTLAEAGSPVKGASNYPLAKLALLDSTCRETWGFTPTGSEPGLCKAITPTAVATKKPVTQPTKPVTGITPTLPPPAICLPVQVGAQVTDGSTWNPIWASAVTLCVNGDCKNPDSNGYATWSLPAGSYTITATSSYGIRPSSASVKLDCGQKSLTQFVIGPG